MTWTETAINIPAHNQSFRFMIKMTTADAMAYVAFDDVTYRESQCLGSVTTSAPVVTASPKTTMNCDFENWHACNWKLDSAHPWDFGTPNTITNQGGFKLMPRTDHTIKDGNGGFIYVLHPKSYNVDSEQASMSLVDMAEPPKGGPVCFRLWYFMKERGYSRLNVTVVDAYNNPVNTFLREYDQGERWNLMQMETNEGNSTYTYTISAFVQRGQS